MSMSVLNGDKIQPSLFQGLPAGGVGGSGNPSGVGGGGDDGSEVITTKSFERLPKKGLLFVADVDAVILETKVLLDSIRK